MRVEVVDQFSYILGAFYFPLLSFKWLTFLQFCRYLIFNSSYEMMEQRDGNEHESCRGIFTNYLLDMFACLMKFPLRE